MNYCKTVSCASVLLLAAGCGSSADKPRPATASIPETDAHPLEVDIAWQAESAASAGDFDRAIAIWSQAIEQDPHDGIAFLGRGEAWSRKGDLDRAIRDYDEAIRIDPGVAGAYFVRAVARRSQGDIELAIEDCNKTIMLQPKYAAAYKLRIELGKQRNAAANTSGSDGPANTEAD